MPPLPSPAITLSLAIENGESDGLARGDDIVRLRREIMAMDFTGYDVYVVQFPAVPQRAFAKGGPGQLFHNTNTHEIPSSSRDVLSIPQTAQTEFNMVAILPSRASGDGKRVDDAGMV